MIDFKKFIDLSYLFHPNPPFPFKFFWPLLFFFTLIFLLGIFLPLFIKKRYKKSPPFKKLSKKIQSPLIIFSLIGLLLLFFRWQTLPYLSSRILMILLFFSIFVWLVFFTLYLKKGFKKELILWQDKVRKMKYLPKGVLK